MLFAPALLLLSHLLADQPSANGMVWEETVVVQKSPGFHPILRFGCWDITRFSRPSTYMFTTPDLVQQGQFDLRGTHYLFRAVMANELENSDKASLMQEMDSDSAHGFDAAYTKSMSNFEGFFNKQTRTLTVTYVVNGTLRQFQLHSTTEGDDQRPMLASEGERVAVGLWQAPDPNLERLDARTRKKIQEDGLQRFAKEAKESDSAMFAVMDLHSDKTLRMHDKIGDWFVEGRTLTVMVEGSKVRYEISSDGQKLLQGGKTVFIK